MKFVIGLLLMLFAFAASAQQPTAKECKEDPKRAGCQR